MKRISLNETQAEIVELHREPKLRPPRNDLRKLRFDKSDPDMQETQKEIDPDMKVD